MSRWEWPPDGWYQRTAAGSVYAGWVLGMLTALAWMLLAGGCWHTPDPVVRTHYVRAPAKWSCDKLESVAGAVPPAADLSECIMGDGDFYWMCSDKEHTDEIHQLRSWIETARSVCVP